MTCSTIYDVETIINPSSFSVNRTLFFRVCTMEALGLTKLQRNGAQSDADARSLKNVAFGTDEEDSFFDLAPRSPDHIAVNKDCQRVGSPIDVILRKNDSMISKSVSPVPLLRSTTKFNVFMLGLGKSAKCDGDLEAKSLTRHSTSSEIQGSSRFSVKRSVEEMPGSILIRDRCLRDQLRKETMDLETSAGKSAGNAVLKFLKMIKPLYLKVTRKKREKEGSSTISTSSSPITPPVNSSPRSSCEGTRAGSAKHLGKLRSASVAGMAPPPARRSVVDDSILEQQDGIRSAILHCKKSYNSSISSAQSVCKFRL